MIARWYEVAAGLVALVILGATIKGVARWAMGIAARWNGIPVHQSRVDRHIEDAKHLWEGVRESLNRMDSKLDVLQNDVQWLKDNGMRRVTLQ